MRTFFIIPEKLLLQNYLLFRRFIPKELRPKQVFPGTGISVDVSSFVSYIQNLLREITFKCNICSIFDLMTITFY